MRMLRLLSLAALAALLSVAGDAARADYSFRSRITITSPVNVGPADGVGFDFGADSSLSMVGIIKNDLDGTQGINLVNVVLSSNTVAPPTDTASVNYAIDILITNPQGAGNPTGTLTVTGVLDFDRSDSGGQLSTNLFTSGVTTATIGDAIFSIDPAIGGAYAQPTVNVTSLPGNISVILNVVSVPEPTSIALMGLGVVGLVGLFRRRRMVRAGS